jgi:hypothetical protein
MKLPTPWDSINSTDIKNISTSNISNKSKPLIAIAISYKGDWNPEWTERTRDSLRFFLTDWCDKIMFMSKSPSLPVARDALVTEALRAKVDYIFFVDTDLIFESPSDPNVALKTLYQTINKNKNDKDGKIVSGLYRAKQKIGFNYAAWMKAPTKTKGYVPIERWNGNWLNVDVTGLGCTLIDINVFRDLPKPWFYWEEIDDISEDFYFFELAKKHGYNLHCFTEVKLSHLGHMKIKCDGTFTVQEL